ncbi:MAG: ABC transporter transmembrane domain-containing protein [Saprospiraceae bacterium]|nr:ABC transporter transmembrane domain-containing protein [Saprospiraceae bacterium]
MAHKDNRFGFGDRPRVKWSTMKDVTRIFTFIRPYRMYFTIGLILLCLSSLIFMVFPGAAGEMANAANGTSRLDFSVRQYGILFLIILVVQGVFSYWRTVTFAIVSEKGMADVRKALYDKLISQPVQFFEERRIGEITSRITADVEQLQGAFSITLAEFLRQIVILVVGVGILAWLAPKLSLIMLVSFPVIVVLAIIFGRYIKRLSRKRQDHLANTNTIVEETLQSFAAVKAFTNEWYESMRYARSVQDIVKISLSFAKIRGLFFIFIITVLFGGIFFVLWQGALFVEQGDMQVGDLFSFIIYTGLIGGAIASIGNLYTSLSGAMGATERILEILERESEVEMSSSARQGTRLKGDIEFSKVSFAYPTRPEMAVLKDVTFSVRGGQKIALVGASGSGKSTIAKLLMHFYNIQSGQLLIDAKPIDTYDVTDLRSNMAVVPQEVILFGGSIRENILYGKHHASEEEVVQAAKQANAWEFVQSFPDGLDTIVGERGIKLSGGQRQRIAIARAILRNPSILILDEATSSLDAEAERLVQDALNVLMQGRTSVIIAHRLSTIREVDCIYVIHDGRIVEEGTHEELSLLQNGAYSSLARLQFESIT